MPGPARAKAIPGGIGNMVAALVFAGFAVFFVTSGRLVYGLLLWLGFFFEATLGLVRYRRSIKAARSDNYS